MPPQTSAIGAPESAVRKLPISTSGTPCIHPLVFLCRRSLPFAWLNPGVQSLTVTMMGSRSVLWACMLRAGMALGRGWKLHAFLDHPVLTPRMKPVLPLPAPCKKSEWLHGRKQ